MGIIDRFKRSTTPLPAAAAGLTDQPDGFMSNAFFRAVNRATKVQAPAVEKYVDSLKSKHATKSRHELQEVLDKQFVRLATTTGIGNGSLATVPGIGTFLSAGVVGGEAILLLEVCGLYALASAHLRGIDIHSEQARQTVVLLTVAGGSGKELISAFGQINSLGGGLNLQSLTALSTRQVLDINSALGRIAFRQIRKRFGGAMLQKLVPLGVGAYLGGRANRKIAREMIEHVRATLGPA